MVQGNDLCKPNISMLVGNLYPTGDVRRDSDFSIFYMGVNIGAFFSPMAAAYIRQKLDWGLFKTELYPALFAINVLEVSLAIAMPCCSGSVFWG